ncbi:ankyrin-3-like [Microplitis mediator]|uniref:ankyrin-3-like n=1 Tax=Microplitis mediator TaxID=375433 RepID=UPI00255681E8|nr:ankyrin-3-like [Microplitis mediator]
MESIRAKFTYEYVTNSIEQGLIEDINAVFPDLSGLTLLQIAAFNKDTKLVDYLLRKGADINAKYQCCDSRFGLAIILNNLRTMTSLVNHGADTYVLNELPLDVDEYYESMSESHPDLISVSTILLSDRCAFTTRPLNIAINQMNVKMVELLLKNNADPNPKADSNGAPLIIAAIKGNLTIMELLLAYGADVNVVKKDIKESPLHIVVLSRNRRAVELLLNHDTIDINMVTESKESALHYGMNYTMDDNIIRQLLDADININLKNSEGETAFTSRLNYSETVNDTITEHIAKCSAANFYLDEEILAVVNSEKFDELYDQCISEIEKMKTTFFRTSTVTYHYVLYTKCVHKLALKLKYFSDSSSTYLDWDIRSIFPLYGGMMTYRLKKALRRKELFFNAIDLTNDIFDELELPSIFTRDVFKFLTNEDLKKLQ